MRRRPRIRTVPIAQDMAYFLDLRLRQALDSPGFVSENTYGGLGCRLSHYMLEQRMRVDSEQI